MPSLAERMKQCESRVDLKLDTKAPIIARIDGRAFHSFTRGLERPFDDAFLGCMDATARELLKRTGAVLAYTQSDEISLVWAPLQPRQDIFFGGRIQKMASNLSSLSTFYFNSYKDENLSIKSGVPALFDARVFNVLNKQEVSDYLLWREIDATNNSILSVGHSHYSVKQLDKVNAKELRQKLLTEKGINWSKMSDRHKKGLYIRKEKELRKFSTQELAKLPPKHEAHSNPDLMIERAVYKTLHMPPFSRVTNRTDVIFNGAAPQVQ